MTPDNTRRETIEECARIAEKQDARSCSGSYRQCARVIAHHLRALASAEPQAREASGTVIEAAETMGFAPEKLPMDSIGLTIQWPDGSETTEIVSPQAAAVLGYVMDSDDEPRPAPAPAAETDPKPWRELGTEVVVLSVGKVFEPKVELFGVGCGPSETGTVWQMPIALQTYSDPSAETEGLVERLTQAVAAKMAEPAFQQMAERHALNLADLRFVPAHMVRMTGVTSVVLRLLPSGAEVITEESDWKDALTAQLAARTQAPEIAEAGSAADKVIREWLLEYEADKFDLNLTSLKLLAARLLASTGSRQEPAGGPDRLAEILKTELSSKTKSLATEMEVSSSLAAELETVRTELAALRSQPASRESGEAMREACAQTLMRRQEQCAKHANDPTLTEEQRETWAELANENLDGARAIRALPTSHSGSAS